MIPRVLFNFHVRGIGLLCGFVLVCLITGAGPWLEKLFWMKVLPFSYGGTKFLEQMVFRVCRVCGNPPCPFPEPGVP